MKINELFDPNKIDTGDEDDNYFPFDFHIEDSQQAEANAIDSKGRDFNIYFYRTELQKTKINDVVEISFMRGGKYDITGWGDSVKVLNTVLMAIKEYVEKIHYPKYFLFNAVERSRGSLYAKLVKKLANKFGYREIEFPSDEFEPEGSIFLLKRNDLTEGGDMKIDEVISLEETQFKSKQQVIDYFVRRGKTAAQGAAAWNRGWRGPKPKAAPKSPLPPEHWLDRWERDNDK